MRKIYVVESDPPTAHDFADAADAGASEIISGFPQALVDAGVSTLGYHEIADPSPPAPPPDRRATLIAAGFTADQADAIVLALGAA